MSRPQDCPREEEAAKLAASLPGGRGALLDLSRQFVGRFHAAIMEGKREEAERQSKQLEAVIWKMNGGTFFGCMADDDSAGRVVEEYTRAAPGDVPMWGQTGEFLIVVDGIRARVDVNQCAGVLYWWFHFRAIDADVPFISDTGYRAHHQNPVEGVSVEEAARQVFAQYLAEKRVPVSGWYADKIRDEVQADWIATAPAPSLEDRQFTDRDGQLAFGF